MLEFGSWKHSVESEGWKKVGRRLKLDPIQASRRLSIEFQGLLQQFIKKTAQQ